MGLIGRERELSSIRAAIARSHAGMGAALVLISGELGSGKSHVLRELAGAARSSRDALVLSCRGEERRQTQGFGLLIGLLRRAIGAAVDGDPAQVRAALSAWCAANAPGLSADDVSHLGYLLGVVDADETLTLGWGDDPRLLRDAAWVASTRLIERVASARPTLLLVDDLHLADDASVSLLAALPRRLASHRLAIVACAEPGSLTRSTFAEGQLESLAPVALGRLPPGPTRDLVRAAAETPLNEAQIARVARASRGNPALAIELARLAAASGELGEAGSLEEAARRGIERLPIPLYESLCRGAVLGPTLWPGALSAMGVEQPEALLDELAARGIAVPEPSFCCFAGERTWELRHSVWADAARAHLSQGALAAAHLAAGRWLRDRGEDPAIVGEHLAAGGAAEEAALELERAARWAELSGMLSAAQDLALRAAAIGAPGDARTRRGLLGVRQGVTSARGSDRLAAEVRALLEQAPDTPEGRALLAWAGGVLFLLGQNDEAHVTRMVEAARRAAALGELETAAWGLKQASFACCVTERSDEAEALMRDLGAVIAEGMPEIEMMVAHARGMLLLVNGGRAAEAVDAMELAFDLACALNRRSVAVEHGCDLAFALLVAGDLGGCFQVLTHAFEIAEEAGVDADQIFQNVIEHATAGGPHEQMDAPMVRRAFARARAIRADDHSRYTLALRGELSAFSGTWPDDPRAIAPAEIAARHEELLSAALGAGFWELASQVESAFAQVLLREGRAEEALGHAGEAFSLGSKLDVGVYAIHAALVELDAARALNQVDRAKDALDRAMELVQREMDRRAGTRFAAEYSAQLAVCRRIQRACEERG